MSLLGLPQIGCNNFLPPINPTTKRRHLTPCHVKLTHMKLDAGPFIHTVRNTHGPVPVGVVRQVIGLTIETDGPPARLGDVCLIATQDPANPILHAEVVGFKNDRLLLMPLGELHHLAPGMRVTNTGHGLRVAVGPELLGRVLDGLGNPIDDRFPLSQTQFMGTYAQAPHPLKRMDVKTPLCLGVRALDGFTPVGKGQRVGIFAGSGVGKSTTLGMIARNTQADLSVIALIGERGREVREFIDEALGPEGRARSVVVVATSDQPALVKIKAGLIATTIAEYFRQEGRDVILMMDSLTRVAMALREVGLAIGEPPATRGYTPSVFAFMPKLLERSGCNEKGSITGLYTVLVEGDDMNEPVADLVRGLLDGHIVLTRQLAEQNHYPAIDVLASVSRLFQTLTTPDHKRAVAALKTVLATYQKAEDLINIGAYVPGSNPNIDRAMALKPQVDRWLQQAVDEPYNHTQALEGLMALGLG
jgi:flagellum-specific ATP synthase